MSFKQYQVQFNEDGTVAHVTELPTEPPRKRSILVRATDPTKAQVVGKTLYSLAK